HGSVENALESGKYNAFKFLSKPVDMDTLIETIQAAHDLRRQKETAGTPDKGAASANQGPVSRFFQKFRRIYGVEK
ncbi:MAG: response regulator, partial [Desulfobacteraceae bacterium]|nr:response regulator [Desulfobacteraceae bacterium]